LRIAFFGRITPVKNVHFMIDVLARIRTSATADLYGPIEDEDYWAHCLTAIEALPPHVTVTAKGCIANEDVPATVAGYDLFFLPTLGENFGHAINEALGAGVPALISDRTPWQALESHEAGWSLPLDKPDAFVRAIDAFAVLDEAGRLRLRRGARRLAERRFAESDAIAAHRAMFQHAIAAGAGEV
jgi:glycosyltransferase involved in cell wall biosynthesis